MNKEAKEVVTANCAKLEKSDKTLGSIFRIMFSYPDKIMAEWLEGGERRAMTFGECEKKIRNAAGFLNKKIARPGDFVGLDLENGTAWIIAFWAILMSGNRPYLINRRHPASLTRGIVSTLGIRFSVASGETSYPCMFIDVNDLLAATDADGENAEANAFADELAISTSATTLNEVICTYTGEKIANQIMDCKGILEKNSLMPGFYKGALKQLAFLPFYHVFGLMAVYFWFSFFARPMVFLEDYTADQILETVKALNVTHIFAVPMLWHAIEKQVRQAVHAEGEAKEKKFEKGLKLSIKLQKAFPRLGRRAAKKLMGEVIGKLFGNSPLFLISGGGYIKDSALRLINGLGYPLHNGYGMSETGITSVELRENIKYRLENSIGKPFDSIKYEIDEEGVLLISGESLCSRLIRNGEEIPMDGHYYSGDIVSKDETGSYFIKGRKGDRIIGESGENINPDEIEKDLEFPFAEDFCVFGEETGAGDETAIVIRLGRDLSTDRIKETADAAYAQSEKLPSSYRIRKFYFTFDPLCAETAIKVSRSYLKRGVKEGSITLIPFDDVLEGRVSGREAVRDDDELGLKVRRIFAMFLETEEENVHLDDHFIFDLGGTSLDYFSLVMKINEELGLQLRFDKESACYTVREFCRVIRKQEQECE